MNRQKEILHIIRFVLSKFPLLTLFIIYLLIEKMLSLFSVCLPETIWWGCTCNKMWICVIGSYLEEDDIVLIHSSLIFENFNPFLNIVWINSLIEKRIKNWIGKQKNCAVSSCLLFCCFGNNKKRKYVYFQCWEKCSYL